MISSKRRRGWRAYVTRPSTIGFYVLHLLALGGIVMGGWSWSGFALAIGLYYARMFFVTAGYHRYFAHRTYKTSRWFQFVLALGATSSAQKGVLWWAANHRHHHRSSDTPQDLHSPIQHGFLWSHVGWILVRDHKATRWDDIKDFARYPELRLINRLQLVPPVLLGAALFFLGGWHALLWGMFVSTVLLWHGTFTINSLSHVFGKRPYDTGDTSRNNWLLALITMGEGWHNNHHHHCASANQGFRWYQIDLSYYLLKALERVRLVRDVRKAPAHIVAGTRRTPRKRLVEPAAASDLSAAA